MKEARKKEHCYDDMLNLPHHVSTTHPQMSLAERAAQFSPFAALTGYGEAVRETARLTDAFVYLDENSRELLDRKLMFLQEHFDERPEVTILFFEPDSRKNGGAYRMVSGIVKKIDLYEHQLVMADGRILAMERVIQIDSELFDGIF